MPARNSDCLVLRLVRQPHFIDKAVAMINMDMIGRVAKDTIYIGGVGTGREFPLHSRIWRGEVRPEGEYSESGYSSSDHTSFVVKQIPFSSFSLACTRTITSRPHLGQIDPSPPCMWSIWLPTTGVHIDELPAKTGIRSGRRVASDRHRFRQRFGYGPYFGSIPDFGQVETGVRFSDVRPGSPAAKAGLKAGDTMIQFGDQTVKNLTTSPPRCAAAR